MSRDMNALRAVALACILLAASACQRQPAGQHPLLPLSGPVPDAPGKLLYVAFRPDTRSVLRTFNPRTKAVVDVVVLPAGSYAGSPSASPEGSLVAYSVYRPGTDTADPGGADLYQTNADGTGRRRLLAHQAPGESLGEPAWAPDGGVLYFTRTARDGSARIERVSLDKPKPRVIVKDATSPTVSAKGPLGFVKMDLSTRVQTLWVMQVDGSGARPLVKGSAFVGLAFPRFDPGGDRVVFAGIGGPVGGSSRRSDSLLRSPWGLFAPRPALAHGVPWDLWVVNADGTGLRRLTELAENYPAPAWSPDGRWIAFTGEFGLYLLDVERKHVRRVYDEGAGSGLTWIGR